MILLTPKELEDLAESCSGVAHENWDSMVSVAQGEDGDLSFKLWDDEENLAEHWTAVYLGEIGGRGVYSFKSLTDPERAGAVCSLTPSAICGIMGM